MSATAVAEVPIRLGRNTEKAMRKVGRAKGGLQKPDSAGSGERCMLTYNQNL